jgi:cytochrome c biogenesis protein CcmG, thiol:disulfide interchange protein DsbE
MGNERPAREDFSMTPSQDTQSPNSGSPKRSYLTTVVAMIAILVTVAVFVWGLSSVVTAILDRGSGEAEQELPEADRHRGVGTRLMGLELKSLIGDLPPISSADIQGQVVLLNFWGPWCPPCRKELPHVAELAKHFSDREEFRLAAIAYPPGGQLGDLNLLREETVDVLERLGLKVSIYCDSDNATLMAVDRAISFRGFPTTVLLDRQGVIRAVWVGYRSGLEDEMEEYVKKLLDEPVEM